MRWACLSVSLSVCRQNAKRRISQKLSNLELWFLLTTYRKSYVGFRRTHYWTPMTSFFCRGWSNFDKISQTGTEGHVDCGDVVEIETRSSIPIWRTFGEFKGMSSQSHLPRCRVLPPSEFNVMIPELRVILQGAVTGRIQCHDPSATCHIAGCKNSIRHVENSYSPYFIFFCFLNAVWALTSGGFRIVSDIYTCYMGEFPRHGSLQGSFLGEL